MRTGLSRFQWIAHGLWAKGRYTDTHRGLESYTDDHIYIVGSTMNKKTKKLLSKVEHQILVASVRFELILSIYGSKQNLLIINRVAPTVFLQIRDSLMESVIISLNRLCDPSTDRRQNKNLSLERLRLSLPSKSKRNRVLQQKLIDLEKGIKKQGKKLNKIRSKRIAHNDYDTHTRNWFRNIPNSAINSCLEMMGKYINLIYRNFDNSSVGILNPPYLSGDGPDRLMSLLGTSVNVNKSIEGTA